MFQDLSKRIGEWLNKKYCDKLRNSSSFFSPNPDCFSYTFHFWSVLDFPSGYVLNAVVLELNSDGNNRRVDIYNRLYRERIIFLGSEIDDKLANQVIGVMLYLDSEDKGNVVPGHRWRPPPHAPWPLPVDSRVPYPPSGVRPYFSGDTFSQFDLHTFSTAWRW